ncbi:MAG TPA: Dickkopf N-terminal cysteine-rich domain-containing protein [Candidatus Kryptonia bacterium]|nr:Dickkopf N-terminal cysteine-rich domain-containing protein [Candidatus Kryptonia bacterium]
MNSILLPATAKMWRLRAELVVAAATVVISHGHFLEGTVMEMRCGLVNWRSRRNAAQALVLAMLLSAGLPQSVSAVDCNGRSFERVSLGPSQGQANGGSLIPALSADGCTVAFKSDATNLVASDSNQHTDVFVRDRRIDLTIRITGGVNGMEADDGSFPPALSGDGQLVAFGSFADNLVFGDANGYPDVFVVDRTTGTTTRVDLGVSGTEAVNGGTPDIPPSISRDGRFVAFTSGATNLVPFPQDLNEAPDVFVFDRQTQTTELISRDLIHSASPGGSVENGASAPALSGDGRFVAFLSRTSQLVLNDTNEDQDVFVWDRQQQTIDRVSVSSDGHQANRDSQPSGYPPAISDDGRFVAFASDATNLVPGDDNGVTDVFLRDRVAGTTIRIEPPSGCSVDGGFAASPSGASDSPSLSSDGRFLVFKSLASNFVSDDTNNHADIFVFDRTTGLIARVLGDGNVQPDGDSNFPNISADGAWITFQSDADNLVAGDSNGATDIFVAANPFLSSNPIPGVTPLPACTETPTATPTSCVPGGCPAGLICVQDVCVTPTPTVTPTSCVANGCPSGEVCVMDRCVTPTPTPTPTSCQGGCPNGQVCVMDRCVTPTPGCTLTSDCPPPQVCLNGMCKPPGMCDSDDDCGPGQVCDVPNMRCVTPTPTPISCTLTSDCPTPQVCINGMCKPPGMCDSNDDCAPGQVCDIPNMRCITATPTVTRTPTTKSGGGGGGGGCSCRVDPRAPGNDGQAAAAMGLPLILWAARRRARRRPSREV